MNINISKLENLGYKVKFRARENIVIIPRDFDRELQAKIVDLAGIAGFNNNETDQLISIFYEIQVMSAIRKASRW